MSMSFVGVVVAISQGLLTRWLIPKLGETRALGIGQSIMAVSFALFAVATAGWMMYAILLLFSLAGIAGPALQSVITRATPANEQGELQGSLVALQSLAAIIAPLLYTYLFVAYTQPGAAVVFPGAAYLAASALSCGAVVLTLWHSRRKGAQTVTLVNEKA